MKKLNIIECKGYVIGHVPVLIDNELVRFYVPTKSGYTDLFLKFDEVLFVFEKMLEENIKKLENDLKQLKDKEIEVTNKIAKTKEREEKLYLEQVLEELKEEQKRITNILNQMYATLVEVKNLEDVLNGGEK